MRILTALAIVLLGCGDDTNAGSVDAPQVDARSPDASSPDGLVPDGSTDGMTTPDAPTTATVGGTIVIADVALLDPSVASLGGISGGSIDIAFDDLDDDPAKGGVVTFGTSPINGCVVTEFNPTHPPHATLDVGTITISDDATTSGGLLKTVGPCTYQSATGGYACISNSNAAEAVVAKDLSAATGAPLVAYVFPTTTTDTALDSESLVGSLLAVNGFTTHPAFNTGTGAPIVRQLHATAAGVCDVVTTHLCTAPADRVGLPCATSADCDGPSTLIVLNAAASGQGTETGAALPYTIINGATPIPTVGIANTDFLGTGKVDINKASGGEWPAISVALDVPGQGWSLSDPGDPTAFPTTAQAVNFGCGHGTPGTSDDTCGDGSTELLQVMIVSGRGTKQNLSTACSGACQPFQMPVENPSADTWVEWTCVYIGAHTATLPQGAVAAILSESPTRVEVRVINAAGTIQQTGPGNLDTLNLLVGHALIGHTTF